MIPIAIHVKNPSNRPSSTATVSAPAVNAAPTRANKDGMFNRDCLHSQNPSLSPIKDSRRLARLAVYFPTTGLMTTRLPTKGLPP